MELKNDLTELNNILDLLEDSRRGYQEASERVEEPRLKGLLGELGASRNTLINEVNALRMKADPEAASREGGTVKGDLHRAWMEVRDALSSSDNANVLNECERGEKFLLKRYEDVQGQQVAPETHALVQSQRSVVQNNLVRITALRQRAERVES